MGVATFIDSNYANSSGHSWTLTTAAFKGSDWLVSSSQWHIDYTPYCLTRPCSQRGIYKPIPPGNLTQLSQPEMRPAPAQFEKSEGNEKIGSQLLKQVGMMESLTWFMSRDQWRWVECSKDREGKQFCVLYCTSRTISTIPKEISETCQWAFDEVKFGVCSSFI